RPERREIRRREPAEAQDARGMGAAGQRVRAVARRRDRPGHGRAERERTTRKHARRLQCRPGVRDGRARLPHEARPVRCELRLAARTTARGGGRGTSPDGGGVVAAAARAGRRGGDEKGRLMVVLAPVRWLRVLALAVLIAPFGGAATGATLAPEDEEPFLPGLT